MLSRPKTIESPLQNLKFHMLLLLLVVNKTNRRWVSRWLNWKSSQLLCLLILADST